jgi:hypothetical protein
MLPLEKVTPLDWVPFFFHSSLLIAKDESALLQHTFTCWMIFHLH